MKINKNLCFGAICSLVMMASACGSGASNSSNGSNGADSSALDTGSQYGQQPRDSTNMGTDTPQKTNTGQGNADPSGGTQNH